ncbi:hypothetical protein J6590_069867 [Homalodisca vitripennis]|nr:hypothetical protein J6590_069867 [Homalodisca vitripennis]
MTVVEKNTEIVLLTKRTHEKVVQKDLRRLTVVATPRHATSLAVVVEKTELVLLTRRTIDNIALVNQIIETSSPSK